MPLRAGASVTDILGGTFGALGILAALRDRDTSGKGQLVSNGLYETAAYLMGQHMVYSVAVGERIPPMPGRKRSWAVYQPFASQEGELVFVGITSDKHWRRFCEVFKRPDLLADASLATNDQRYEEFERLTADLIAMFAQMPKAEILQKCEQAEIPFAPVNRPEDLFEDEHLNATGSLLDIEIAPDVMCKLPRLPISVGEQDYGLHRQPPRIGEHTHEILRAAGYTGEQIAAWVDAKVVVG
jgi:crotonobetainyl-CoA:carnitine CoA-transferase CaiB-like acyl-CoA transferase